MDDFVLALLQWFEHRQERIKLLPVIQKWNQLETRLLKSEEHHRVLIDRHERMIQNRKKMERQYDRAIEEHMVSHPRLKQCQAKLINNRNEQQLIKHTLWPAAEKNHKAAAFHEKRRNGVRAHGGKSTMLTHDEKHQLHVQASRSKEKHHDHYVEQSQQQFNRLTKVSEKFVLVCHCPNIWSLEGKRIHFFGGCCCCCCFGIAVEKVLFLMSIVTLYLIGHAANDHLIPTVITMLQVKMLATSLATPHNGRCVQALPMGDALPSAVIMLFATAKDACAFSMTIIAQWEALLTNPDPNHKVTSILGETGHIKSIVAQLHPNHLPILSCVLAKGKSWRAPGGYGIVGPALSEAIAVALATRRPCDMREDAGEHMHVKRDIHTRDRPRERLEYLCCASALDDITHSAWWKQKGTRGTCRTKEHALLERMGIPHYFILNEFNGLLNDEKCAEIRDRFELATREGYGRTLHAHMNLFDVPDFLSMLSVRSCVRTKLTTHALDLTIIEKYRKHKTVMVCILKGYSEPWKGYREQISTLANEGGAASSSGKESFKARLKRQRMQALEKKRKDGERGRLFSGVNVEHVGLGELAMELGAEKHGTSMEYWRNLMLFKQLFRDSCEEVECYDRIPVPIGVVVCDGALRACDMACRIMDALTIMKRTHRPGNIPTIDGPLVGELSFGIASGQVYDLNNEDVLGLPLDRARLLCEQMSKNDIVMDKDCLTEYARELKGKFVTKPVDGGSAVRLCLHRSR